MKCRHCAVPVTRRFIDLGTAPPSNAYLCAEALDAPEVHYPLRVLVCDQCRLVQTQDVKGAAELFGSDYAYFSSTSSSFLAHAERFVAGAVERFGLGPRSNVVEVAANDGYLLQYVAAQGIPCYGVEPTASTAAAAREKGIEIVEAFFGEALGAELAAAGRGADLMVANNVLAHVPDINDFARGFQRLLKPEGVASFEFPHLFRLIQEVQFDTIYHEHFSYLSLTVVERILGAAGLKVIDVEELSTHGGSLRVYAAHASSGHRTGDAPERIRAQEDAAGLMGTAIYDGFQPRAEMVKDAFIQTLIGYRRAGISVAAYGAAAKGNTLLNFAGVRADLLPFVVDRSPGKRGKFLPGSRIPIVDEAVLAERKPERIVILPWNIADEIAEQLSYARAWGARFVTAIPAIREF
ncbi:MAG: class I SAM-dependent methyltransferase [Pseudomonadota bacterium]